LPFTNSKMINPAEIGIYLKHSIVGNKIIGIILLISILIFYIYIYSMAFKEACIRLGVYISFRESLSAVITAVIVSSITGFIFWLVGSFVGRYLGINILDKLFGSISLIFMYLYVLKNKVDLSWSQVILSGVLTWIFTVVIMGIILFILVSIVIIFS